MTQIQKEKERTRVARLESRLSESLRASLIARQINSYFGMAITSDDVMRMDDCDIEEMLAWIGAG